MGTDDCYLCIFATFLETFSNKIGSMVKLGQYGYEHERLWSGDAVVSCSKISFHPTYIFWGFFAASSLAVSIRPRGHEP